MIVKKYFLAILMVVLGMMMVTNIVTASEGQNQPTAQFTDLPSNHPFKTSIENLREKQIIKGYPDKTFKADNSVSRAELVTMVFRNRVTDTQNYKNCFLDVNEEWFAPYVCYAKTQGIVKGYPDGRFRPELNIGLHEVSSVLVKTYGLKAITSMEGEPWYKQYLKALELVSAIPVSLDRFDQKVSRGETGEMVLRLNDRIKERSSKTFASLTSDFPVMDSCAEFKEKIKIRLYQQNKAYDNTREVFMPGGEESAEEESLLDSGAPMTETGAQKSESGEQADEYSQTNVQVAGVDEADIIKNDGEFIYMVSGKTVRIVKAYTPDKLGEIAKLDYSEEGFRPHELYISPEKLVILGWFYRQDSNAETQNGQNEYMRYIRPYQQTKMIVINMIDKSNLVVERSLEIDGSIVSSRRIDNMVYLVLNYTPNYYYLQPFLTNAESEESVDIESLLPRYRDSVAQEGGFLASCSQIRFLPQYEDMNMLTVAGIDLGDANKPINRTTIMGTGEVIYSSLKNLYVAAQRYSYPEVGIFDSWAPGLYMPGQEKTVLYRFALNDGNVTYHNQGEVNGHLLNQFSMDENGDIFRVALTTGEVWDSNNPSKNHLYILNANNLSEVVGKINDIAPGETIYSVRFMGNRAYMVTFKKIDPFFVIDLADPANPSILGALKIPGYSDYLHPYDENHILGFGKETVDPMEVENAGLGRDFDFAWYQGMKVALFDVTDVANPKVLFKEVIGDRGTESELLYNHKALFFDKKNDLLAFPVTVAEIKDKSDQYTGSQYGETVFQGAYIYKLDLTNGFQLKAKVTHYDPEDIQKQGMYWYDTAATIHRVVSIGEYLYTISLGRIKAISRDSFSETNVLDLEVEEEPREYWIE